jgi:tRNA (uracil-5-)-methyltransferase TRM9
MNAAAAGRLLDLNRDFYERFGPAFSATRRRLQPGVRRILEGLSGDESILDLGCGNGELARELAKRGQRGPYLGLDFSLSLLREAGPQPAGAVRFQQFDITSDDWTMDHGPWSMVTAFAVLHHIPGETLRLKMLKRVHDLLAEDGRFVLSNWQFLNSARLTARLQPWSAAGLAEADVDPGDHLLDWRSGGQGLRYVHQFSAQELAGLAGQAGLRVRESFLSDGEGGRLSLYQVWEK